MIGLLIGVAVLASASAMVLIYWRVLALTFPEKLSTDEVYMLSTDDLWKIRVCRYRKGRTNGQPVLLVHGANVNQHTFTSPKGGNLVEYLVERGFDCWTVDLRGCHSSEAPFERHRNQISADDFLNYDIPAAIRLIQQETGYAKIHYCGQSLGGMLLYAYVLKFGSDAIASGVTLGSPIGFDGVRVGRSPWMARLIKINPALAGEVSRGLIPFALLFRSSPFVFPMNMRNIARGLSTGHFYNMLEDPLPGVLRELMTWIVTPGWRMDGGQLDVQEGLKALDVPLFTVFAPLDPFVPLEKAKAFFEALPTEDKRILIASRELGCKRDYNHCDLAFGLEGPREIFGPISRWFDAHSSREQIAHLQPAVATGYQAPLRASERANILSGDSFARLTPTEPAIPPVEVRVNEPVAELPPAPPAIVELPSVAPVEAEAPSVDIAETRKDVPVAPVKKPATLKSKAKVPSSKPVAGKKPAAKVSPAAKVAVRKAATGKKTAEAPEPKKAPSKKPATKKAATKKPSASKAVAPKAVPKQQETKNRVPSAKKSTSDAAKPVAKAPTRRQSGKGADLSAASEALNTLRPTASKGKTPSAAPIRVKASSRSGAAAAKDDTVETPKSVLKALSNASSAMEAFNKKAKTPKK